jgi:hypothetical protein
VIGSTSRRWLAAAAAVAVVLVVAFAALAVLRDDDAPGVDCATFRVTPDLWARASYDRRLQLQQGMSDCGQLIGQPDTQIVAMLGPPDHNGAGEIDYYLPFGPGASDRQVWRIHLDEDAKVKASQVESPPNGA